MSTKLFTLCLCLLLLMPTTDAAQIKCLEHQKTNLIKLKKSLQYSPTYSTKLASWNSSNDCCGWRGVSCAVDGSVAGLDLSNERIFNGLDDPNVFLGLTSLQSLNLSNNLFINQPIPSSIYSLASLRYLNLAACNLTGPINDSFGDLRLLEELHLEDNEFFTQIPRYFANFTRMRVLFLRNSFWIGRFPQGIFHLPALEIFTVSNNRELEGALPEFHSNSSIKQLVASQTRFGGIVPASIGNLNLTSLKLFECEFEGEIPGSLFNMSGLRALLLQRNNFTGLVELDWFAGFPDLYWLALSDNLLTVKANRVSLDQIELLQLGTCNMGEFPFLGNQSILEGLDLTDNHIGGTIPSHLPQTLTMLLLSDNKFNSSIELMGKLTSLTDLSLDNNSFHGEISASLCNCIQLETLSFEENNLNGSIPECLFRNLGNLVIFIGGSNQLSGTIPDSFHDGCKIHIFDLSRNLLRGPIPDSIGNCKQLWSFSLGINEIYDTFPCQLQNSSGLETLILSNNLLHGDISCVGDWPNLKLMSLSFNYFTNFSGFHDSESMARLKSLFVLHVERNRLQAPIPSALCSVRTMEEINFQSNALYGSVPECLVRNLTYLKVLSLGHNTISGSIPDEFHVSCKIKFLLLTHNDLKGSVPKFLTNCAELELLDLSNNRMRGFFPCQLKNSSNLKVLSLRNNRFHDGVECIGSEEGGWRSLRIIDISNNQLTGALPDNSFVSWDAAITDSNGDYSGIRSKEWLNQTMTYPSTKDNTSYNSQASTPFDISGGVAVTTKGSKTFLEATVGIFTAIDFSGNQFSGPIPESLGLLLAMRSINLSHNAFSGAIPSSLGNLSELESLDLSNNELSGSIPPQLANLRFLQDLNLSMNKLVGRIPTGTQLQSFSASSYEGNEGLYGPPLSDSRSADGESCATCRFSSAQRRKSEKHVDWLLEGAASGFVFGLGLFFLPLVLFEPWRARYNAIVESFVSL